MTRALVRFCGCTLLAGAAACGGRAATPSAPVAQPVPATAQLYYDNSGGIRDSVRQVIRDQAAFEAAWRAVTSRQASPPPLPAVDFGREMLLLVGAGRRTPEDEIRVDSVAVMRERDARGKNAEVLSAIVRTTEGCGRFRTDAYPVAIVRVRRFDGTVRFVERHARAEGCAGGTR